LRWGSIRIDEEQLGRRSVCAAAEWTTALTTATGRSAVNELATIGADLVRSHVADESVCTSIAETITPQLAAAAALSTAATTAGSRFKKKHLAIDGGLQI
jgi:cytochrome b